MKCSEIMTSKPMTCVPEDNISTAVGIMWDYDCGAVPIVRDEESNELVGIITDRDIAMHVVKHAYVHPCIVRVKDCMSTNLITCKKDDELELAMNLIAENRIRRIPIIDENGCCIGILSQTDILAHSEGIEQEVIIKMLKDVCSKCTEETVEPE